MRTIPPALQLAAILNIRNFFQLNVVSKNDVHNVCNKLLVFERFSGISKNRRERKRKRKEI